MRYGFVWTAGVIERWQGSQGKTGSNNREALARKANAFLFVLLSSAATHHPRRLPIIDRFIICEADGSIKMSSKKLTVFYDGECPICTKEIGFYKDCAGAEAIEWTDITKLNSNEVHPGLSKEQALARFHVLKSNGELVSGGPAFAQLWKLLRKFRFLGVIAAFPPIAWVLDRVYDVLLIIRPGMQKLFK